MRRLGSARSGFFSEPLPCLRPAVGMRNLMDAEIFGEKLVRGRVCSACDAARCGVYVHDTTLSEAEAAEMVSHGKMVQAARAAAPEYGHFSWLSASNDIWSQGHLRGVRLAERLRRLTAKFFGISLRQLSVTEHFVRRSVPEDSSQAIGSGASGAATGYTHTVHCDEAINLRFHYSAVLYLSEQSRDFEGGELTLYHNRSWPWLLVEPSIGRAVFYSSGWENIHRVKPVTQGERWAFVAVFARGRAAEDGEAAKKPLTSEDERARASAFAHTCVHPTAPSDYVRCGEAWAEALTP